MSYGRRAGNWHRAMALVCRFPEGRRGPGGTVSPCMHKGTGLGRPVWLGPAQWQRGRLPSKFSS